jgi:hypothetical protein
MSIRERGSLWPVVSVVSGAFLVLVVLPLVMHRQQSGRMATVDAQVTIGDDLAESVTNPRGPSYRWPESEVPRTAERLRDVTAVAIATSSSLMDARLHNQTPRDAGEILKHISQRQLIPIEWLTDQAGVLQTTYGTIHLRYAPQTMRLELLSVPNERKDGPAMLIRIPDAENTSVGPRYFESLQLDGIIYPQPFAPIGQIIASGWQPRPFKQTQIPDEQRAQLETWLKNAAAK